MRAVLRRGLWLGLGVGLIGCLAALLAPVFDLEQRFGLEWLFKLRGPRAAPAEVVIVAIDHESAAALDTEIRCMEWPRTHHARLVDALARAGAALVVFDVTFPRSRPLEDPAFAAAIKAAGNVLLVEKLAPETSERDVSASLLREAALGAAASILPRDQHARVDGFWLFRSPSGDGPVLPAVALQMHGLKVYDDFLALLKRVRPNAAAALPQSKAEVIAARSVESSLVALRKIFLGDATLAADLRAALAQSSAADAAKRKLLHALIALYSADETAFFDLYGPARAVTTLPYHAVLRMSDREANQALRDKVVFVGFSPKTWRDWESLRDDYHTAFSQPNGLWLSGVELAATAFANLLEDSTLKPLMLWRQFAIYLLWGIAITLLCFALRVYVAGAALIGVMTAYFLFAYRQFAGAHWWWPLVIPLALQAPLAFITGTLMQYREARRGERRLGEIVRSIFPRHVADKVIRSVRPIKPDAERVYGICLATDVKSYSKLSEAMDPAELVDLMNAYFETLSEQIEAHEGIVADLRGDAIMALWAKPAREAALQEKACRCALGMARAIAAFNRDPQHAALGTRIGLHAGEVVFAAMGGASHFELRAVGSIVNAASRIEALGKQLGTDLLASSEVTAGVNGVLFRPLGDFVLAGLTHPIAIAEIVSFEDDATEEQRWLCRGFANGLDAYSNRRLDAAREVFATILTRTPEDGPTRFYLKLCDATPRSGPWDATVHMEEK